jgi:hypothetical protein
MKMGSMIRLILTTGVCSGNLTVGFEDAREVKPTVSIACNSVGRKSQCRKRAILRSCFLFQKVAGFEAQEA